MTRTCTVCSHEKRYEIDRLLVNREASYRGIASRYSLTQAAVGRHVSGGHIAELLTKAHEAEQAAEADDLLADIVRIRQSAFDLLDLAERSHEWRARLGAIRECRENIRILAELRGKLATQGATNILVNPEYVEARTLIVQALEAYPAAREAVLRALEDDGNGAS